MENRPTWRVKHCTFEQLEATLNEMQENGYAIDRYEMVSETFFWYVVGHLI